MTTKFVNQGIDIIKEAVQKDNAEEYEEALKLYQQGIQYLITGLKYEKNNRAKEAIKAKCAKYLARAEEIKTSLAEPKKTPMKENASGASESKDPENDKLQESISSAIVIETPNVKWEDVAGLRQAKELLKEAVILPVKFPQLFKGKRKPWRGILLYGPPGTGKSYLAKAVATEANGSTFFSVSSSSLVSKYVGESEKLVKNLFEMARARKPAIVFIDEVDSLASARSDGEADSSRRLKTEFLVQMQGVGVDMDGVLTLGATNCPWDLDPAIRRRFQKRIYIPLPEAEARSVMFRIHIGKTPCSLTEHDYKTLGMKTEGFSGSDISTVVNDAMMEPIRTMQAATHFKQYAAKDPSVGPYMWLPCPPTEPGAVAKRLYEFDESEAKLVNALDLAMTDFIRVLSKVKPSVSQDDLTRQEEWTTEFGQEGS